MTTSNGFANNEFTKRKALKILKKNGDEEGKAIEIVEKSIFNAHENLFHSQFTPLGTSEQIKLNNTLKETLKYLREHANKSKEKKYAKLKQTRQ